LSWEYLNERCDDRLKIISKYLKGKTKGKFIVDLDCLEGRILNYLEHDYMSYKGNDLIEDRWVGGYKATFKKETSVEFVKDLTQCDILLLLGYTGDYENVSEKEDHRLTVSAEFLIDKFSPEIVVIEVWVEYRGGQDEMVKYCQDKGYKIALSKEITNGERMLNRYVVIMKK
jgi:hypothetical protein